MRIAIVGATGRTGRQLVEQALTRGHDVTALARHPDSISIDHPRLTCVAGDVLLPGTWMNAFVETEAVVSALGIGTSRRPTSLYSVGTGNVLQAMSANHVGKLAVMLGPRDVAALQLARLDQLLVPAPAPLPSDQQIMDLSKVEVSRVSPPFSCAKDSCWFCRLVRAAPPRDGGAIVLSIIPSAPASEVDVSPEPGAERVVPEAGDCSAREWRATGRIMDGLVRLAGAGASRLPDEHQGTRGSRRVVGGAAGRGRGCRLPGDAAAARAAGLWPHPRLGRRILGRAG
jgi:hypothetical protein